MRCDNPAEKNTCDWTPQTFKDLIDLISKAVPEGLRRQAALERIDPRLNPDSADPNIVDWRNKRDIPPPPRAAYEAEVALQWEKAGCEPTGAPHVAASLSRRLEYRAPDSTEAIVDGPTAFERGSPYPAKLAARFLEESCAGARGLKAYDQARLRKLLPPGGPPKP